MSTSTSFTIGHQPMNFPCVMLQIWMAHPIYGSNGAPLHAIKLEIGQNLDQTRATNTGGPIGCPSCCRLCWLVLGMERSSLGSRDSYCLRFLFYVHRKFSPCEDRMWNFSKPQPRLGGPFGYERIHNRSNFQFEMKMDDEAKVSDSWAGMIWAVNAERVSSTRAMH